MFGVLKFAYLPFGTLIVDPDEILGWTDQCKVVSNWEASVVTPLDWADQASPSSEYTDIIPKQIDTKRCKNAT